MHDYSIMYSHVIEINGHDATLWRENNIEARAFLG